MNTYYATPGHLMDTLRSLPDDGSAVTVKLAPGEYREKAVLSRPHTVLEGAGAEATRIVWDDGALTLLEDGQKRGTFRTATLLVDGDDVTLRGLTVENAAAPREAAGQAVALYVDAQRFMCEDCHLLGYQDTLFTAPLPPREVEPNGFVGPKQFTPRARQRHAYRRCLIRGDVDFIFGGADAWFEDCEIRSADGRLSRDTPFVGFATAASTPQGQAFGYVFNRCRFTAENLADGTVYLGRPWREFARTVLLECELGAHIHPDGFGEWSGRCAAGTVYYAEYQSRGPGARGPRADFVRRLSDEQAREIRAHSPFGQR